MASLHQLHQMQIVVERMNFVIYLCTYISHWYPTRHLLNTFCLLTLVLLVSTSPVRKSWYWISDKQEVLILSFYAAPEMVMSSCHHLRLAQASGGPRCPHNRIGVGLPGLSQQQSADGERAKCIMYWWHSPGKNRSNIQDFSENMVQKICTDYKIIIKDNK